jgi:hypothetical protein
MHKPISDDLKALKEAIFRQVSLLVQGYGATTAQCSNDPYIIGFLVGISVAIIIKYADERCQSRIESDAAHNLILEALEKALGGSSIPAMQTFPPEHTLQYQLGRERGMKAGSVMLGLSHYDDDCEVRRIKEFILNSNRCNDHTLVGGVFIADYFYGYVRDNYSSFNLKPD